MNEGGSKKPFRIKSELSEDDRPRWRVRTDDGQLRGPLSDNGLKALVEVGILTESALLAAENSEEFNAIGQHPMWDQLKLRKTELTLKKNLTLSGSRPPFTASPFPKTTDSRDPLRVAGGSSAPFSPPQSMPARESVPPLNLSTRRSASPFDVSPGINAVDPGFETVVAEGQRRREAAERAKSARAFTLLRCAGVLRAGREICVVGIFLAAGDLVINGFGPVLGSGRWLIAAGIVLAALVYYIFEALQD